MCMNFALIYQTPFVIMHKFYWILDGDEVVRAVPVDVVDHRGERRRLARAGGPGDEDEALAQAAEVEDVRGEVHVLGRHDLVRDLPHHRADALAVGEDVDPEARRGRLEGEVGVVDAPELLAVLRGGDRPEHRLEAGRGQDAVPTQRDDVPVEAQTRVHVAREVEVAGALVDHRVEQIAHRLRGVFRGGSDHDDPLARLGLRQFRRGLRRRRWGAAAGGGADFATCGAAWAP